jgi:hypothetical protein
MIVPYWQAQHWWPDFQKMMVKMVILGKCEDVLVPGGRMRKQRKHLPPGDLVIA